MLAAHCTYFSWETQYNLRKQEGRMPSGFYVNEEQKRKIISLEQISLRPSEIGIRFGLTRAGVCRIIRVANNEVHSF
jgi:hypothetical protein